MSSVTYILISIFFVLILLNNRRYSQKNSNMVLPKKNAVLTQEERIRRLKETRLKYSQIGKQKNVNRSDEQQTSSTGPPPRPAFLPKQMAPRPSFAPRSSIAPRPQKLTNRDESDFEVDPNSLAMIKSGKITIPTGRPSISSARHTIGSRQSLATRPFSRFVSLFIQYETGNTIKSLVTESFYCSGASSKSSATRNQRFRGKREPTKRGEKSETNCADNLVFRFLTSWTASFPQIPLRNRVTPCWLPRGMCSVEWWLARGAKKFVSWRQSSRKFASRQSPQK